MATNIPMLRAVNANPTSRRPVMAYVITQPCIGVKDGACVAACPVDCIHPKPDDPKFADADQLFIDPGGCICCGACTTVCPVEAIFDEADVPAEWKGFIQKNADHFRPRE